MLFTATATYSNNTTDDELVGVEWSSSNQEIATISPFGLATAHKASQEPVTITAIYLETPATASLTVTPLLIPPTLVGAPTGVSKITSLNVTVSGSGVVNYRSKIGPAETTVCTDAAGYSSPFPVAVAITNNISAVEDCLIRLCVIGIDAEGTQADFESVAIAEWTKDTTPPTPTISGAPTGISSTQSLNTSVGGVDVVSYRSKVANGSESECANSSSYSSNPVEVFTPITSDLSAFSDGSMVLCVIGTDAAGNETTYANASPATWTRETGSPPDPSPSPSNPVIGSPNLTATAGDGFVDLSWNSPGGETGFVLVMREGSAVTYQPVNGTTAPGVVPVGESAQTFSAGQLTDHWSAGLVNGPTYHFAIWAHDGNYNYSQISPSGRAIAKPTAVPASSLYITNGEVKSIVKAKNSNMLYLGGTFTEVSQYTGNGIILDSTTAGQPAGVAWPVFNGAINVAVPDPERPGGFYVGGAFSTVGTFTRNNLVRLNPDGTVDTTWDPIVNNDVYSIAIDGNTVYVGGLFTSVGLQTRNRIAALDATTAEVLPFNPNVNSTVNAIAVSDGIVYMGGGFGQVGGVTRARLAAVSATNCPETGCVPTSWNPMGTNSTATAINAIRVFGSTVYFAGTFTTVKGTNRSNLAAVATSGTGALTSWVPNVSGLSSTVAALEISAAGNSLYVGGAFTQIKSASYPRNCLAEVNLTDGTPTAWNPTLGPAGGGVCKVKAISVSGNSVYLGGTFTSPKYLIASIDAQTGSVNAWDPKLNGTTVNAVAASGTSLFAGGTIYGAGSAIRNYIAAIDISTGRPTAWDAASGRNTLDGRWEPFLLQYRLNIQLN